MNVTNKTWVNGLDTIRFVLAMMVFLSHLENAPAIVLKSSDYFLVRYFGIFINHAYLGPGAVIAFFIISGFVIHYPVKDKPLDVGSFLVRRWLRIGIPLFVVVCFAIYFDRFILIPIWSLYCELIYYTIYPILRKLKISWRFQFVFTFFLSLAVIAILADGEINSMIEGRDLGYTGSYAMLGDWLTWIIGLPCWLLGVMIADNLDSRLHRVSGKINLMRGVVWLMAMVIVGLKAHYFISYIVTLNLFSIPLAYWLNEEINYYRYKQPIRWIEFGGKFSYSLYLLHGIFVSFTALWLEVSIQTYFIYVLITVLGSFIFYKIVEEPSHQFSKYLSELVRGRRAVKHI